MTNSDVSELCCGCSACIHVCPRKCIIIKKNWEGFYKAYYDKDKCINCGKCHHVCPLINTVGTMIKISYAFVSLNKRYYDRSSSGGFFSHAAEYILSRGGSVFGCAYDSNLIPTHIEVDNSTNIDLLRRSKYIQSYLSNTFLQVKDRLLSDKLVLFVGTPCQVAGLKNFLSNKYDNLYTIDLICHGTPSIDFFLENIEYIQKKRKRKIRSYDFRLKTVKNDVYYSIREYVDGVKEIVPYYKDAFFGEFYNCTSYNECCYECPYSSEYRAGDLTIGDYEWGKKYHKHFSEYKDISCVLVNNEQGEKILRALPKDFIIEETELKKVEEKNLNLIRPTIRPNYRDYIYSDINRLGYERWIKRYFISKRYLLKLPIIKNLRVFIKDLKLLKS